ncbi:MAG: PAS domain S-box protein [Wenzhouxiangellaceae bacterium]|nr:PAS domain S-box protein [Wenzhouxiangellaceae bacterium]
MFHLLADNAREMVSRHMPDLTFLYASPASTRVLGYRPDDLIGVRLDDLTHPDDLSSVLTAFAMARETLRKTSAIFRCRTPKQTWRWCEIFCRPVTNASTGIDEIHSNIRDVSKYKQIEKAIERVAGEWRSTFDSAQDAIMMLDRKANIMRVNLATLSLLDCEFKDLIGKPLAEATRERLQLDDPFQLERVWAEESQIRSDLELDKKSIWLRSTVDPVLTDDGRLNGAVVFITNITTEKQAEIQLMKTLKEFRELSSHLQNVREEERRSIAREVHDELGHALTALKMDIAWLVKRISPGDDEISSRGAELAGVVDQTIGSVRRIVSRLRPPVLDDLGLDAALEWLAADFQKHSGVETRIEISDIPKRLRGVKASSVFRIVQEALTNVSRHARASKVSIHGCLDEANYHLTISDDGRGFEPGGPDYRAGFGLLGMAERVHDLEGTMEMNASPGQGTALVLILPRTAIE